MVCIFEGIIYTFDSKVLIYSILFIFKSKKSIVKQVPFREKEKERISFNSTKVFQ